MATLQFADTHNLVTFLAKPTESDGFEQIVDFFNAHPIRYALKVSPTIYISSIELFSSTAMAKTINGEAQLHAKVDGKKIIVTESSVRRDLRLVDEEEILDQTFDRLQKLESQLELLEEKLSQEDVNQNLLRSLSPEWNTHVVVWRNKANLDTMSMDDLYKNLKVYEPEVKGMKLTVNGNETIGFDKSNVECYNCHKSGSFAKEYRASRNQDNKYKESSKRSVHVETSTSIA
nr:ribonuclease H-like domain-containing protein [Tanacetum cinerariifolium]